MNNKILIFDTEYLGHHKEYIHHLLLKANGSNDSYVFCVPKEFKMEKTNEMDWRHGDNVSFSYIDIIHNKNNGSLVGILKNSYYQSILLRNLIKKHKPSHVFLITLISILPLFPFLVHSKIKVSGIIYQIYLYRWKNSSFFQKTFDVLKYLILSKFKVFDTIYMLNSKPAARKLNSIYKTDKFDYLPDPYVPIKSYNIDLSKYNINWSNNVFFQFGEFSLRKGSLNILKSLGLLESKVKNRTTIIMLGRVSKDIKGVFEELYEKNRKDMQLVYKEGFFDFDVIASIAKKADVILLPYTAVCQSSGVVSYAAQFDTPVLAPSSGMIGHLVKSYKLGYTIDTTSPSSIAEFINNFDKKKIKSVPRNYLLYNNVDSFIKALKF